MAQNSINQNTFDEIRRQCPTVPIPILEAAVEQGRLAYCGSVGHSIAAFLTYLKEKGYNLAR